MNTINFLSLSIALLMSSMSLNAQSEETRTLSSFDGISVSQSIDAEIIKGNKNEVVITVSKVDLGDVITEVEDGVLKVKMKKKWNYNWTKKTKVKAVITYKDYPNYISVSSSADLISRDKIITDRLELKASSSADLVIEIDVDELEAKCSSSSDIEISGSADRATVSSSSSSDFLGENLTVRIADLSASSSSDIYMHVTDELSAKASSSSDIEYSGNPDLKRIKKSSGADIERTGN